MDKFDLKKFITEGKLLKENNTQKIKVWRESYDKSPFNAVLIKKIPNNHDDAYIASVDLGDGNKKEVRVAYGLIPGPKNKPRFKKEVWFMLDPFKLDEGKLLKEGKLPIDYNIDPEKNWSAISDILMGIKDKKSAKEFIDEYVSYVKNAYKDEKMVQYGNLVYAAIESIYHNIDEWEGTEDAYPLSSDIWEKIISQKIKKDKI